MEPELVGRHTSQFLYQIGLGCGLWVLTHVNDQTNALNLVIVSDQTRAYKPEMVIPKPFSLNDVDIIA
jgi:hypothetical protein